MPETQGHQIGETTGFHGDPARKHIVAEIQFAKGWQLAHFRWYRARQPVFAEGQGLQIGEVADFHRDTTRKQIGAEIQHGQVYQLPNFRRDRAGQIDTPKIEVGYPPAVIGSDSVPIIKRSIAQPVCVK